MPDDVHPQIQAILDRSAELAIPAVQDLTTDAARALVERLAEARRGDYPAPDLFKVEMASTGPGYGHVPVRIYWATRQEPAPVIVFYHGGGHVFGSLDTHDTVARFLARTTGCAVVSADYRMAPEHPFPAAVEDAYEVARWVADRGDGLGFDAARLVVCGDSAGANLAAVCALMARDSKAFSIAAQVLVYPVIDYRGGTGSFERYARGYGLLEADTVTWFLERYLPDRETRNDWRATPRNAPSHAGLPPALVLTAECDVLRDEGAGYAGLLEAAGTDVEHVDFPGMIHGFFGFLGLVDDAERAHRTIDRFLKGIL